MPYDRNQKLQRLADLIIFAMFGAIMFISKIVMEVLPNIHLLGMFTMTFTIVYRKRALIPIYVYVMINGLYAGFALWWFPYLYLWAILWGITMLLPRKMPAYIAPGVYAIVCSLFGLAFGTLYAPAQALMFGLDFKAMIAWIVAGLPYDLIHAGGNFATGLLIVPLATALRKFHKSPIVYQSELKVKNTNKSEDNE